MLIWPRWVPKHWINYCMLGTSIHLLIKKYFTFPWKTSLNFFILCLYTYVLLPIILYSRLNYYYFYFSVFLNLISLAVLLQLILLASVFLLTIHYAGRSRAKGIKDVQYSSRSGDYGTGEQEVRNRKIVNN